MVHFDTHKKLNLNWFMNDVETEVYESFKKSLNDIGLSPQVVKGNLYNVQKVHEADVYMSIQLVVSGPVDELLHGSHNGNIVRSIGVFKIEILPDLEVPDYYIFHFSSKRRRADYIIIPSVELKRRLIARKFIPSSKQVIELVFWLMPDLCLYETTDISIEGEWYFMSKGINGRMSDGKDWDYTQFLNSWESLNSFLTN